MTDQSSILAEDAERMPLALRRIARAFLDRDHLDVAAGLLSADAEQAVADARYAAVAAALADGYITVDGTPVPGTATVRDPDGRSRLYLCYRDAQAPTVEAFGHEGERLGVAHLAVQFPLAATEVDWDAPWHPVEVSLAPIDVGFDPRAHDMTCAIPRNVSVVSYETQADAIKDRERRTATGTPEAIRRELDAAGYRVSWADAA